MTKRELAVVMPVYNEEGVIEKVVNKWTRELGRLGIDFQIHVYNDGSKDNTLQILKHIAKKNNRLILHDTRNSGHGPTILQGYRENSDAEWIFQTDSDDEIEPEAFEDLWKRRYEDYHLLIGRREYDYQPLIRRLISMISRIVIRALYGNRVFDVNAPYRLMKGKEFKDIFFKIPDDMFAPNIVISGYASLQNMHVYQTIVQSRIRTTGEVSIKRFKLLQTVIKSFIQTIIFRLKM